MATPFARFMRVERLIVLSVLSLFALIVIATSAAYISTTQNTTLFVDGFQVWPQTTVDTFAALNLAVGVITKATVIPVRIIDWLRRGAFTSMIVFELCWLGVLDVLWIAAGGLTANNFSAVSQLCSENTGLSNLSLACGVMQASMAFSFLNFIMLTVHIAMLLTLALTYQSKGISVWTKSVSDVARLDASAPSASIDPSLSTQEQYPMKMPTTVYEPVSPANVQSVTPMQHNVSGGYTIQV